MNLARYVLQCVGVVFVVSEMREVGRVFIRYMIKIDKLGFIYAEGRRPRATKINKKSPLKCRSLGKLG